MTDILLIFFAAASRVSCTLVACVLSGWSTFHVMNRTQSIGCERPRKNVHSGQTTYTIHSRYGVDWDSSYDLIRERYRLSKVRNHGGCFPVSTKFICLEARQPLQWLITLALISYRRRVTTYLRPDPKSRQTYGIEARSFCMRDFGSTVTVHVVEQNITRSAGLLLPLNWQSFLPNFFSKSRRI